MKFGQLIEFNMRTGFLEKWYTKRGGETSPRTFSEKLKLSISLDQWSKVLCSLYCIVSWGLSTYFETKLQTTFFHLIKLFLKIRGPELVSLPHFLYNFWRKIFFLLYSLNWPNFIVWLPLLWEILGNMCTAIICKPGCDIMNFDVNLIFLIKPFFLLDQKVETKTYVSWEWKELLRWNKKYFSSILKGFQST